MMKNIKLIFLTLIAVIGFTACEQDDDLEFIAQEAQDLAFNTSFLDNYVLNANVSTNLAERFTWGDADFGVPTNITYYLQAATMADFSDYVAGESLYDLGNTVPNPIANEIPVTVGQMIALAEAAGLDNDPATPEENTGVLYFRLMAVIGDTGLPSYSEVQALNVELQEESGGGGIGFEIAALGVVGSGYNNWGAYEDGYFFTTDSPDVYVSYVTLVDGEIKFRLDNDWGINYGGSDGSLVLDGNNIPVTAGDYKITVDLAAMTYVLEEYSWGVVGSAFNDWGNEGPDGKFYYDYTTDTFKKGIRLMDGEMKIRFNNNWDLNYGDSGADGTIEEGGDNIVVSEGHYLLTLDLNAGTITINNEATVLGVVGSGFNDWGGAGPDFSLTEIQDGVFYGDLVNLLDGEIKFRANNDWGLNYGDSGADGIIDTDGDNIAVSAGAARIKLDINTGEYSILQGN